MHKAYWQFESAPTQEDYVHAIESMRDQLTESWGRPPNLDDHIFEVSVDEKKMQLTMSIVPMPVVNKGVED